MPAVNHQAEPMTAIVTKNAIALGFHQRKDEILQRLQAAAEQCSNAYSGRKELASESDAVVQALCQALEEAFTYGLRQQTEQTATGVMVMAATNLLQNMTEIVTGNVGVSTDANDGAFWQFCRKHLTPHERERYDALRHVRTKGGKGRAFIRAALNECALQRYVLTWLSEAEILCRFYTPWSLLLDPEASRKLPHIVGSLNDVLFALSVDEAKLNVAAAGAAEAAANTRIEPIIYAPTPTPAEADGSGADAAGAAGRSKRKTNAVERPISSSTSTEDLLAKIQEAALLRAGGAAVNINQSMAVAEIVAEEHPALVFDPIEPELAFLKEPLQVPDFRPENHEAVLHLNGNAQLLSEECEEAAEEDNKSDSSSQYSKSSGNINNNSNNNNNVNQILEEKYVELGERYALLQTRVAELTRENRLMAIRLKQYFEETGILPDSSLASNFLITMPVVQLLKPRRSATGTSNAYYAYEVHITMRKPQEHWTVWRRYREFHKLHQSLLRSHPHIACVDLPPKKHFGNMNSVFVEERRRQLQIYLLNLVEALPFVDACKTKTELQKVFPFFRER